MAVLFEVGRRDDDCGSASAPGTSAPFGTTTDGPAGDAFAGQKQLSVGADGRVIRSGARHM